MTVATQSDIEAIKTLRCANRSPPLTTDTPASGATRSGTIPAAIATRYDSSERHFLSAIRIAATAIVRCSASMRRDTATSRNRKPFS